MPPHPLTNFEIQKSFQNETKCNGVYSRDNPPDKIKNAAYVITLDEHSDIATHWITLYALNNNITYVNSFGVKHIPKEIKNFINKSIIITDIFRIQVYDSIVCGYFYIGFINYFKGETLTDFTNLFSPNTFNKNMM